MKKLFCAMLAVMMMLSIFAVGVSAADKENMTFSFDLSVNGKDAIEVETGDIITVDLYLNRTDADESYTMRGMQAEIRYDSYFFELVQGSWMLGNGIKTNEGIKVDKRHYEFYMNTVSLIGGVTWQSSVYVGSFKLKVIATSGVAVITNEDTSVANPQGSSGGYNHTKNDVSVSIKGSKNCTVEFESNGGTEIPSKTVKFGSKLPRFDHPTKEGYYFAGWFKDIELTKPWDFDNDIVDKNMTLYAKWSKTQVLPSKYTVTFETNGGSKVESVSVKDGGHLKHVDHPTKKGYYFAGWYKDAALTQMWDFDEDVVRSDMTLYAKWSKTPVKLPCEEGNGGFPWGWLLIILLFLLIFIIIFLIVFFTKKVTFESNGGTPVKTQRAFRKRKLRRPTPPTKEGCTFVGWAKDEACTVPWRFNVDEVTESMTLYAKWRPDTE